MSSINKRIVLAERPVNRAATEQDFLLQEAPMPEPAEGEVLVRTHYLSLDPYMRTRISPAKSYVPPIGIGELMIGEVVGEVMASRHPTLALGDKVLARSGWQAFAAVAGDEAVPLPANTPFPDSYYLGVLGMPGMTAYFALQDVCRPRQGEVILISAAAGAVGQVAGQLAKLAGCRVIGSVGSAEKAAFVKDELGFDDVINYKGQDAEALAGQLSRLCPDGIDMFFDSVGGPLHDAAMQNLAIHARTVIVGTISRASAMETPDTGTRWTRQLLVKRATMQGFLVWDYAARADEFRSAMGRHLNDGHIRYREEIAQGLEQTPRAFISMLAGGNLGKQLVQVHKPA